MTYAAVADVRAAGVPAGTADALITTAIAEAQERVDVFTGDVFESRALTVRAIMSAGLARLPLRVQTVTAVRYNTPTGTPLSAGSYFVTTSAVRGDVDAVRLVGSGFGGSSLSAILDVTYEPFRASAADDAPVYVDGTFGWSTTPDAVHDATVLLALAELAETGSAGTAGSVNTEGDANLSVPPRVPVIELTSSGVGTTGVAEADRLLELYRRSTKLLVS